MSPNRMFAAVVAFFVVGSALTIGFYALLAYVIKLVIVG